MVARKPKNPEQNKESSSWLSFLHFGESYSSLLLGIVVVIITTVLLVFLVKDRNLTQQDAQRGTSSTNTQRSNENNSIALENTTPTVTIEPTVTILPSKTPTVKPTMRPTVRPTNKPTQSKIRKLTPTLAPTKTALKPTATPVKTVAKPGSGKTHTVVNGENLWTIAEKYYKSGYNWVDISRVNNLSNPGLIRVGMKLTIPDVTPKLATIETAAPDTSVFGPKITGTTYTVKQGDHLWGVAVRAFGDGYKWVEIARINNINTPNIIQPGLVLKLPRTASSSQK